MKRLSTFIVGDSHLGARVALSFGLLIAILSSIGWLGIRHVRRVNADLAEIDDQSWHKVKLSRQAQALSTLNSRLTMEVFLVEDKNEVRSLMLELGVTSEPGKGSTFWFTAGFDKQPAATTPLSTNVESLENLRVLIVDDNATNRRILAHQLGSWGMMHAQADSGARALALLREATSEGRAYDLAILDLLMPEMDGFQLARAIKADPTIASTRLVILTSTGQRGDAAIAREDLQELRARIQVGAIVVELQQRLAERVIELEEALAQVKRLQGIVPICSYCKHVRNDQNYWQQVESYVSAHSEARFSHSVCPACYEAVVKPQLADLEIEQGLAK